MTKFITTLIATSLLLVTSQVSAKVSVEAEKAQQVNAEILVTSATDYLNIALNQPKFVVESTTQLTAQNILVKPNQRLAKNDVQINTVIEAE